MNEFEFPFSVDVAAADLKAASPLNKHYAG